MLVDVGRPHAAQAEDDDARQLRARGSERVCKIEVVGENHRVFSQRLGEDLGVGQAIETFLVEVAHLVAETGEKDRGQRRDDHVEKESHAAGASCKGSTVSSASHAAYLSAACTSSASR